MSAGVVAFLYNDYYCYGIKESFKGIYSNIDNALETIRGGRYENENLEILNLDTLGITRYRWVPLYIDLGSKQIKHRYDKNLPILDLFWNEHRNEYEKYNMEFNAGEWSTNLEDE